LNSIGKNEALDPRYAERLEAVIAILINTLLWLIRLIARILVNSAALIADA